ncbi:MAG: hypothetical protein LBG17_02310 [Bacteroidales bacterium]|jgi:hypothetical protein|nr:hypothetical protein [Bacteroidales bacterium]
MGNKYIFNGKDITLPVVRKIERIVNILSEQLHIDFETAYQKFLSSRTYTNLANTNNYLWAESAEYIVDDFFRELNNTH